ncbi:ATP-binding protein [Desulfonatronovibrio magnus]|uniref:ATP-binding protein n=1 Tax=Desulfonatronovibrio magnus TaxID=698827 RepID=UPI000695F59D|nr:ATP-binding protein [Desulfonatronovibrio magnus]
MNKERMKLPLGISDFLKLREAGANYLYVDKTAQLAGLLGAGNYLFLARPRRFGKSLLCSTMRCLYEGRRELFAGLAIEPEWDWGKTNPVVHLSLTAMGSQTVDLFVADILAALQSRAEAESISLRGVTPASQFLALVEGLYEKTGRRVVVIVDEYEKPVHDHLGDPALAKQMRDVLASFYGALKGCDGALEKVFITGIGRMVKTSIFSELNQMIDLTLAPEAAEICGYTEDELYAGFAPYIDSLAERNGLTEAGAWQTLRDRYNGYWWGHGEKVYNPWAILNCFRECQFGNYWWASGTPGILVAMVEAMRRPDGDLDGVEAGDLSLLFDITRPKAIPLFWQSGYLTIKEASFPSFILGFPNAEVREAWYGMMLDRFMTEPGEMSGQTAAAVMLVALRTGDTHRFERALKSLFAAIPGELHVPREAYYHSVFFAALSAVGAEIIPESRSDKGRLDAVLKTDAAIYVIEFKLGRAEDALAQIEAKRYYEPWLADGRPIVLLGAGGFMEKEVKCLWKRVDEGPGGLWGRT